MWKVHDDNNNNINIQRTNFYQRKFTWDFIWVSWKANSGQYKLSVSGGGPFEPTQRGRKANQEHTSNPEADT